MATPANEATAAIQDPIPYQYFVLQAVPRPERGECVNVAVVLYAEDSDVLALAWEIDEARLLALDPAVDVDSVRGSLEFLKTWCDAPSHTTGRSEHSTPPVAGGPVPEARRPGARFGWLAAPRSTMLRPGPVHGGVSADPRAEVARLMSVLVRPPRA